MSASSSNRNSRITIVLISSDGERFKVDYEAVAMQCKAIQIFYEVYEGDKRCYRPVQLRHVSSRLLLKIIDYCMKHAAVSPEAEEEEDLKYFDSEFVNVDHNTLVRLIIVRISVLI